jgi:hypothetical protein
MDIEPTSHTLSVRTVTQIKDNFTLALNSTQNTFDYAATIHRREPTEKQSMIMFQY